MVIDFHTHVFPEKIAATTIKELEKASGLTAATNGCVDGLLSSMEQAGVDTSVIMPVVTSPRQFNGINRFAHDINEKYGFFDKANDSGNASMPKLISFGGIHPDSEDYKGQLKELKSMGFPGIKLHPDYQRVCFDDIRYERIVSYASELDMIVLVHAGIDIGLPEPVHCSPAMSLKVIKDTQAPKLVLAHLGGWKQWDEVEALLVGENVYLDLAFVHQYITDEQVYRIVEGHGSDRILFATDSPWSGQRETIAWLQSSRLSDNEKEKICELNAMKLLGID